MLLLGRRGRPKSIQFWLAWLVVACILPAAMGAAFLVIRSYEQQRSNLETARVGVARALMQVIDGELAGAASVLQVLAVSPFIASGDFAAFQDRATHALTTTSGNSIVLSRPDGGQVINTLKPFGTLLPAIGDAELRRRTWLADKPVVSDVFVGPVSGQALVAVQVPVVIDGRTRYTLSMGFFSERLSEILLRQHMPDGWVAAIYDRRGVVAARTLSAGQFTGRLGAAAAVRHVAEFPEGSFETVNLEGKPVDVTFSRSTFSGWAVVIAIPAAVATAELKRSLWLNAAGAMATLMLGALLARRIGRRISLSITALGTPALAMGSDSPVVLPTIHIIEVDALRTVLQKAASLIEQERDAARDAERRMIISVEAAGHANRAKSEFLASISHELRTPLHGILGYAELLRLEGDLNPRQSERLKIMMAAGAHLLGMINAVLDMSQIEANQMELHPQAIDLPDFARACLDVVRPAAEKKGLALTLAPATPLRLFADPTRLRQALVNLLGNGVKFTSSGTVEVRLLPAAAGATIRMEVVDSGPGVPAEHRDKLFRSFERLGCDRRPELEGAGLGLALSARLVTLMGGSLGHDDNPAGGSIFWLELPIGDASQLPATAAACDLPDSQIPADILPTHILHVLVVDDVAMNRDIASCFLCAAGHQVTCAESGAEAIEAVANTNFDVVLMDVRMPGMDGLEATRRIRLLPGPRGQVPIVALTAQAFTEQVAECRAVGMDSHLGKPFDQANLLAVVARAAEARLVAVESLAQAELQPAAIEGLGPAELQPAAVEGLGVAEAQPAAVESLGVASTTGPDASVLFETDQELPVFDQKAFELTASCLAPDVVASYLRTIAELGEALLRDLPQSGGPTQSNTATRISDTLADAVHTIAGSAGMFGFRRLCVTGRRFEQAARSEAAETPALADQLAAAVDATLGKIYALGSENHRV